MRTARFSAPFLILESFLLFFMALLAPPAARADLTISGAANDQQTFKDILAGCEVIAHFMAEVYHSAKYHDKTVEPGHKWGIKIQNMVRRDFRQEPECLSAVNHYKNEDEHTGFKYIEVDYGHSLNEKLSYDESGKLVIRYYKYDNVVYKPGR